MAADLLACRVAERGRGCTGEPANKDAIDFRAERAGGGQRAAALSAACRAVSGCFCAAALQGRV